MSALSRGRCLLSSRPSRNFAENLGGGTIAAGHGVRVVVEGCGVAGMCESFGDDQDSDAGVKHFGGHEVPQVV